MNKIRKYTLCLCMAVITALLMCSAVYADNYEFTISGPDSCGVDELVDVTVTLTADEALNDSDAFLVFDTDYFEYADTDFNEYDNYAGTVRLRGDFSEDSYSCSWTVTLKAINEGTAEFSISDKWVQNASGTVVTSTADGFSIEIGEGSSVSQTGGSDDEDLATEIYVESEFEFHFREPDSIPSCFEETTGTIFGMNCKVWKFNSGMQQDVDYSANADEFYAVYGYIDSEDEAAWYVYDTATEALQRLLMLQDIEVEKTPEQVVNDDASANETKGDTVDIFSDITKLIVVVFVVLVILIIVINVVFSRAEKKSRQKRVQERQRLSHEEIRQKRELERKIQEKRIQEGQSQNMRRPDDRK